MLFIVLRQTFHLFFFIFLDVISVHLLCSMISLLYFYSIFWLFARLFFFLILFNYEDLIYLDACLIVQKGSASDSLSPVLIFFLLLFAHQPAGRHFIV